jgi:hypothetical protein
MTDTMAIGAQNKTFADFGHNHLCRSAASDRCTQTKAFGLPVMEIENAPIFQAANPAMGLIFQLEEQVFTPAPTLTILLACVPPLSSPSHQ